MSILDTQHHFGHIIHHSRQLNCWSSHSQTLDFPYPSFRPPPTSHTLPFFSRALLNFFPSPFALTYKCWEEKTFLFMPLPNSFCRYLVGFLYDETMTSTLSKRKSIFLLTIFGILSFEKKHKKRRTSNDYIAGNDSFE